MDLFQFFVALSIPFAVVGIGAYFTASQAQDTAFQSYLDGMAKLLMDNDLANSEEGDEVRTLARAQTLTVLASLDPQHKRSVVEFLHSSNLIGAKTPVITLTTADLSDAALTGADLRGADLMGARLPGADLSAAHLEGADLFHADLWEADLFIANLQGADLREARLQGANLAGAYLVDADLERATVTDEQLDAAYSLKGATIPTARSTTNRFSASEFPRMSLLGSSCIWAEFGLEIEVRCHRRVIGCDRPLSLARVVSHGGQLAFEVDMTVHFFRESPKVVLS